MKLITFKTDNTVCAGFIDGDDAVICVEGSSAMTAVRDIIAGGDTAINTWKTKAVSAARQKLSDVTLMAPMPELVRDVFCVGKNYYAHAREFHSSGYDTGSTEEVPSAPVIFTKATTSLVGPGDIVRGSLDPTGSVDYEGELGVVIGKRASQITKQNAFDVVFGYVALNDVTSRDLQQRHNQWVIGKGIDTFCPMGPWIATADEVKDVTTLKLETHINGELRQQATLADLVFDIPTLIETLSSYITLLPGDVIATGTPVGVGIGFTPPKYLVAGDRMDVSITGLGVLTNTVG